MLKTIDLFAGAGGLSYGFESTREFLIVAAAENNKNARKTYVENHKGRNDIRLIPDVRDYDFSALASEFDGIDVVIGGPPCQGFSNANRQKNHIISMNNSLVKEYFRAVKEIRPKAFVMENVSMLSSETHRFYDSAKDHDVVTSLGVQMREDELVLADSDYNGYSLVNIIQADAVADYKISDELFQLLNVRIRDHFHSDSGIGGAYEQAIILKKFIEDKQDAVLYENKNKKFTIQDVATKRILPIVLTLNQFGGLAVNTSLILEKEESQPYPWVCNWHDLENIIEILKYLNKEPEDFIDYIIWRIESHPNVLSSDELNVIEGYFMNSQARKQNGAIFFPANGPSLIDKIYFEKHAIPYEYPVATTVVRKKKKIGRNEPCPCGSGKKFKKCCIEKGIYD